MNTKVMQVIVRPSIVCRSSAFALAVAAGTSLSLAQTTYHVAPCGDDSSSGANALCAAPDGPKRTIQAAITAAIDGDVVVVADGTYTGAGNRDIDFLGKVITLSSENGPDVCIIDCRATLNDRHRAFLFREGADSAVEGFTVRNAYAPLDDEPDFGGAVLSRFSSPVIRNCTFHNNQAFVGGVMFVRGGDLELIGCSFHDNTAGSGGGAIWSQIDPDGHGILTDCTFLHNRTLSTDASGGGGVVGFSGDYTLRNCRFVNNVSARITGGIEFIGARGTVTDCTFVGNVAANGGALGVAANSMAAVSNCLFSGNRITGGNRPAAALWVGDGTGGPSHADVVNCTFSQNIAPAGGAALAVTQTSNAAVANCIFWGDGPREIVLTESGAINVLYSDVQGGWPDNGNADPLFADPGAGDFHLRAHSPCIDAGDNTAFPLGLITDGDGNPRFRDDPWTEDTGIPGGAGGARIIDMGAYEFQGSSCQADFNNDRFLNSQDFFDFLAAFFANDAAADFNRDAFVNSQDFFDFLTTFFVGCA